MNSEIELSKAKCTSLSIDVPVELGSEEKEGAFQITAYTGEVVDRWWGKLSIDVDGIKAKNKMPVFRGHDQSKIVGYSSKAWKDGSFFVSGKFSEATEAAREAKALADEGFPWQASIGVRPLKILSIKEGTKTTVNAKTLKGPAEVWVESEVFEVSFVPLGADSKTSIATFSQFEEAAPEGAEHKPRLPKGAKMEITIEVLEKDAPGLLEQIRADAKAEGLKEGQAAGVTAGKAEGLAEGAKAERERIQAVSDQSMPGHEDLIKSLMYDGKTTGPEAAVKVLAKEREVIAGKKTDLESDAAAPANHATPPDVEELDDGTIDEDLPVEERAKAKWEKDQSLRAEFGGDYDTYLAYETARDKGLGKILGKREGK